MQYVDVALATRLGLQSSVLTYAILPEQLPNIQLGVLVEVPFRNVRANGVVVALHNKLPIRLRSRLRPIRRVLAPWPLFSSVDIDLRKQVAELSGAPLGITLSLGLPPHSLMRTSPSIHPLRALPATYDIWIGARHTMVSQAITAIKTTLADNQSVLFLVPTEELVLSWQDIFNKHGLPLTALFATRHAKNELAAFEAALTGKAAVVLGTRRSIFLPFRNLGLTVVDQPSHPQLREEQAPHYDAWQVAVIRNRLAGGKLIFRDELPPLSLFAPENRRSWQFHQLSTKAPKIHILARHPKEPLLPTTMEALRSVEKEKKSALLVVSRAHYAAGLICEDCKELFRCPVCRGLLELTQKHGPLFCPTCPKKAVLPSLCPHCQSARLVGFGWGAAWWHEYLAEHDLSSIRVTSPKQGTIATEPADLVVAIEPERLSLVQDYRREEQWLRFLLELKGHARERLMVETTEPEHAFFSELTQPLPKHAIGRELVTRRRAGYPPFGQVAEVVFEGKPDRTEPIGTRIKSTIQTEIPDAVILGPTPVTEFGAQGRWQLLIKLPKTISSQNLSRLSKKLPGKTRFRLLSS